VQAEHPEASRTEAGISLPDAEEPT
jgi:hypothetical protein